MRMLRCSSADSNDTFSFCSRAGSWLIAFVLFLSFVFAQPASAQNAGAQPNVLGFGDNFIVSGDFAIGGTGLGKAVNGFASGTISIGNGKDNNPGVLGTNTVPQGAQIVEALLYWQAVEIVGGATAQNGFFMPVFNGGPQTGYAIKGTILHNPNGIVYWTGTGCASASPTPKQLVTYRADVRGLLPQDANGNVIANGDYHVTLASQSNGTPLSFGASLVLVYRVLSPTFPLNAVVIYNGSPASTSTMTQKMVGFYDAAQNPVSKLTYIVGNGRKNLSESVFLNTAGKPNNQLPSVYQNLGLPPFPGWYGTTGTWDNTTWFFNGAANPLQDDDSTVTTVVQGAQQGCVTPAAIIYSTTVKNTDGDGLLNSWKLAMPSPGYCDAVSLDAGICHGSTDPGWVDLSGAHLGEQDVFVQLDYMCSSSNNPNPMDNGNKCDGSYDFNPFNPTFGPLHLPTTLSVDPCAENVIQKVVDAFADVACQGGARNLLHQPINLHVIQGNAVPEFTCSDVNNNGVLCPFPDQPGVVGWKGGFAGIKNQLVDSMGHPGPCLLPPNSPPNTPPPPGCAPRFQHGKKDSWHYALFGHALGLGNLSFIGGTLAAGPLCPAGTPCVAQTGNMVTVYTTVGHGLTPDALNPGAPNGRVTIADAFTNPNLIGTFKVTNVTCPTNPDTNTANDCSYLNKAPGPYTFTINIGNSASATYTQNTDPNLSMASGLVGTGSGFSDLGGQDSLITLANWGADATPKVIAGTFMHELGHSLGLSHGGLYYDNLVQNPNSNDYRPTIEANCKPNFPSVMTYHYQRTLIDNHALDYAEEWLPNPPPSASNELNENGGATPFFMFSNSPFSTPPYQNTFWYVHFLGVGTKAKAHCDGTPIRTGENDMIITTGATTSISWTAPQDINFDGTIETVTNAAPVAFGLRGHSDWTPTFLGNPPNQVLLSPALDLRQIAATGNLSVAGGSANLGGGSANIGGGSANLGGGSANLGGGSANLGGGSANLGGGSANLGGGSANIGGGNGDLDRRTADAVTLPPSNLTAIEDVSPRKIHLFWFPPGFGQIGSYNIYRQPPWVLRNPPTFSVPVGDPRLVFHSNPADPHFGEFEFVDTVNCNPNGYSYFVTAVLGPGSLNPGQESGPTNTVSTGQDGGLLTGCYTSPGAPTSVIAAPSVPANAVQGSIVSVTFTVQTDFNATNSPVNTADNPALVTLVANGPGLLPNCGTGVATTLLNSGQLTAQSGAASTFPASIAGQYTFNWDTDGFCAGQYTFTLTLGGSGQSQTTTSALPLSIDINDTDSTPHVNTLALTAGTVGLVYNNTLTEHGGTAPFTWSFTGSLPPSITLGASTGTLSGTTCVAGPYSFTAMVTDSKSNSGSQPLMLQINKANTTTGVASNANANTSVFQQPVTFTVTVAPQGTCSPPTGTVTLSDGGVPIASSLPLNGSGMATFTTSALTVGIHNITASYSGDANFISSNSATLVQTVNKASTTTTIISVLPSPAIVGQAITVAYNLAVVAPGAGTPIGPSGTITVTSTDGSACMPVPAAALGPGACVLSPAPTTAGIKTLTVSYSGDNNFLGSPPVNINYTVYIYVSDTAPPPFTPTKILPNAVVGSPYSSTVYESGGVPVGPNNFSWTIVPNSVMPGSGSTLPGLSFQPNGPGVTNGTLSGTPTSAGTFTFTAMVTDSASPGNTGTQTLTITVLAPAPAPFGLVSWYPFEGNANDLEKINNGNVVDTPQFVPGEVDNGFKPGPQPSGSLITIPDSPTLALTQFTIGAWIRVDAIDNVETMQIVWKGDSTAGDLTTPYSLSVLGSAASSFGTNLVGTPGPGKVLVILTDHTHELDLVSTNALPLDGKFHYVAVTADGRKVNLYIDGVLDGSSPASESSLTGLPFAPANPLQIGGIQGGPAPGNNFDGVIDELQIWNRVLTSSEVSGIFSTVGEFQPAARPAGLVSWWPAEGNLTDIISGNNGAASGGVGFAPGEVGQAFSFNGVNGEIQVPDNANLDVSQITIEAWVKPTTSGHGRPIVQKRSSANVGGYTFESTDTSNGSPGPANGLQFGVWIGGTLQMLQTPANVLTIGAWQHVAATFDGSTMTIYVNGVQEASSSVSGSISTDTDPLVMGFNVTGNGADWDGFIDEVSLYNRALTATEIQGIVNAGGAGKAKP